MKNKIKRQLKIERRKINIQEKTKYAYGVFKCLKTAQLNTIYGQLLIPQGEILFAPNTLGFDKELIYSLEDGFKKLNSITDLNNSSLLIVRYGGIGDLIASLFGISELKNKFNNLKIGFISSPSYNEILTCFPGLIDQVFSIVEDYELLKKYKYISVLDNTVENNNEELLHNIYSRNLFVENNNNTLKNVILHNIGHQNYIRNGFKRQGIGVQYMSGSFIRNYSLDSLIKAINLIHKEYPTEPIFLLGPKDDYNNVNYIQSFCEFPIVPNGCGLKSYSLNEIPHLISHLKLVIGPDSSMLHVAGVCDTPMLGLFGPFNSSKRLSNYNNVNVLEAESNCSPCNRHFPLTFCPHTFGEGLCLNQISPEQIAEQVKLILN